MPPMNRKRCWFSLFRIQCRHSLCLGIFCRDKSKVLLCAAITLAAQLLSAAAPEIYLITPYGPDAVLVHFDIEKDRKYELQHTLALHCGTNLTLCTWKTIYTVQPERAPNHYIVTHFTTNKTGFYRLRVTP
jgi:hypothetical protein